MDAVLVRLKDPKHQEYVQRHPYLCGPDFALNRGLRDAWPKIVELRKPPRVAFSDETIDRPLDQLVGERNWAAIVETHARVGLSEADARTKVYGWGWKVEYAPTEARRILSIGCANGHELLVLRALFPDAELCAVDFDLNISSRWREVLRLGELRSQSIDEYLREHEAAFDLVFSNHTLEHLFEPDVTLGLVRKALVQGGTLVSGLPMEGDESSAFYDYVLRVTDGSVQLDRYLDLEAMNPGHAWKTNREDLAATLHAADFRDIRMITRANYPSFAHNHAPTHVSRLRSKRVVAAILERATLLPLRRSLRAIYPVEIPEAVVKTYYRIAMRCWFSRGRMLHELLNEIVVVATAATRSEKD